MSKLKSQIYALLYNTVVVCCHIFSENSIAVRRVVNKDVGDCSDKPSVLDDRTAAHSLHNTAGFTQQSFICDFDNNILPFNSGQVKKL